MWSLVLPVNPLLAGLKGPERCLVTCRCLYFSAHIPLKFPRLFEESKCTTEKPKNERNVQTGETNQLRTHLTKIILALTVTLLSYS